MVRGTGRLAGPVLPLPNRRLANVWSVACAACSCSSIPWPRRGLTFGAAELSAASWTDEVLRVLLRVQPRRIAPVDGALAKAAADSDSSVDWTRPRRPSRARSAPRLPKDAPPRQRPLGRAPRPGPPPACRRRRPSGRRVVRHLPGAGPEAIAAGTSVAVLFYSSPNGGGEVLRVLLRVQLLLLPAADPAILLRPGLWALGWADGHSWS